MKRFNEYIFQLIKKNIYIEIGLFREISYTKLYYRKKGGNIH